MTFDDFGDAMYVYEGDDFSVDAELFAELEISSLLVKGDVRGEYLAVQDILPDYGVFCVTGSVRLRDMSYATESTGVVIGGDLEVSNVFYADCGNSVLQVNGDLTAKVLFNAQCSIDVRGRETSSADENADAKTLSSLGIPVDDDATAADAVRAYFEKYESDQ